MSNMESKKTSETDANPKRRKHKPTGFEEWGGYMAAKKMKLQERFEEQKAFHLGDNKESQIFKGVAIFVNGYTKPPADELKRLMLMHGGKYHHYYSLSKTTHVIASNLPNSKMKDLKSQIVIKADWITDSIKNGKLLPHHNYLLYTPEMVDKQQRLKVGGFLKDSFPVIHKDNSTFNQQNSSPLKDNSPISSCLSSDHSVESPTSHSEQSVIETLESSSINCPPTSNVAVSPQKSGVAVQAGHPDFLAEFYSHSRLHHISNAGQELKRYVQLLAENNKNRHFPGREELRGLSNDCSVVVAGKNKGHVMMHLDMDCFFVSVGLRKHPELKGVPIAVTHAKGRKGGPQEGSDIHFEAAHYTNESKVKLDGVTSQKEKKKPKLSIHSKEYGSLSEIASCSYEARKAGVRNGMFLGEALRRCPNLKTMPYDFEGYSEVSKQLYNIVASYTLDIEAVSCDELYIDCTDLLEDICFLPNQFATALRAKIEKETGCTASAGIGSNMLLARLANRVAKPNGQYHISDSEVGEFMRRQKVQDLPGVGYSTTKRLESLGVVNCEDLQSWSLCKLQQEFGPKTGQSLFNRCRGKDERTVQLQKDRKSVSAEINYGIRFETEDDVYKFINELAVEVQNRLQNIFCKGKSLTLKLMVRKEDAPVEAAKFMGHGVCDSFSKSVALKSATDSSRIIGNECCILARSLKIKPQDYRGVGIQVNKLESTQKENKSLKTMKNFLCQSNTEQAPIVENLNNKEVILEQPSVTAEKLEKSTIKDFLSNQHCSKSVQSFNVADYIPEQLEQSVLDALPEEIRKEVLESCLTVSSNKTNEQSVPTCSKWLTTTGSLSPKLVAHEDKTSDFQQNDLITDPQLQATESEFDQSFLDALPEDIRKEVLNMYAGKIKEKQKELSTLTSNQLGENKPLGSKTNNRKGHNILRRNERNELIIEYCSSLPKDVLVQKQKSGSSGKKASLGGAVELEEIRDLLKEWITNTKEPLEEDVNDLKNFLIEVTDEKDLLKVDLILKYLYRVAKRNSKNWKDVYLTVLSQVQQKVKAVFGFMLVANTDFPT